MTLEQLKQNQLNLNNSLRNLLDQQRNIVSKITGDYETPTEENPIKAPSGLIEEIDLLQQTTYNIISELNIASNRLSDYTYEPVVTCNSQ